MKTLKLVAEEIRPGWDKPPARAGRMAAAELPLLPGVDEHLVTLLAPSSAEAEQYRSLRLTLERLRAAADCRVLAITSPAVREGKTTTAINLAGAFCQPPAGRIVLVDVDLRRPAVATQLALVKDGPGLTELVREPSRPLDSVLQRVRDLHVITAGRPTSDPYPILQAPGFTQRVAELSRDFDRVILDLPPILPVPDHRIISQAADGLLLIVAAHHTPRPLLEEALNALEPEKLLGLVFNRDDRALPRRYYGDYGKPAWTKRA
ncbi:MAG TPA: CpsD/CapB family tyrosine-protein kinase [Candidatus Polarisedimenticolaceae bacterium]|nr:CpsD/CapB family tyrosine-protein kinase [Candidatus Polarisedimenticolaceae bacterium]